jgi:cobalt-zinc-cadmium efflux system outer membrane protein
MELIAQVLSQSRAGVSGGTTRSPGPAGNPGDARSVTLTQPLDLPWRRSARIGAAEAGLEAAGRAREPLRPTSLAYLRGRYFEVLRREAELRMRVKTRL